MKRKWTKLPGGRHTRYRENPLLWTLSRMPAPWPGSDPVPEPTSAARSSQPISYATDFFDIRSIECAAVTVFGAGSVGSYLTEALGPARLILRIIDCKKVELKHAEAGRTVYGHESIGQYKVHALKSRLERDYPGTTVEAFTYDVKEIPDSQLRQWFEQSWMVVIAIDDPDQMFRINDLAYSAVELIQVGMHRQARSSHVAISIPLVTPCLRCTLGITKSADVRRLDSEPANSLDIRTAAHLAAVLTQDILYSKATGKNIVRWQSSKNLIYIANYQQSLSPDGPGLCYEASQKRPGCPICNPS